MKHIICLLLCLALVFGLAARWRDRLEWPCETTTGATTIPDTTVKPPIVGEGVYFQLLDLNDERNAAQKELVQAWKNQHSLSEAWKYITELALSDTITVYETPTNSDASIAGDEIRMRNETTGEDIALLQHGEFYPALQGRIDERYFIFAWCYPVYGIGDSKIYDTVEKREIQIERPPTGEIFRFVCEVNDRLFFRLSMEESTMPDGKPHVLYLDIADVYAGKPFEAVNLLEGFSGDVGELGWPAISPDGRYLAARTISYETDLKDLVVFDLVQRKLMLQLPISSGYEDIQFADAQTLYCYNRSGTFAYEITLP